MAVRDDFAAGEVLAAADLNDTFASKVAYPTGGNDGDLLAKDGTAAEWIAVPAAGLTLINATAFSAVGSISVNNVFDATYDRYLILIDALTTSGLQDVKFRLRASGSDATGSNYARRFLLASASTVQTGTSTNTEYTCLTADTTSGVASYQLVNPFAADTTRIFFQAASSTSVTSLGGAHNLSTSYDGFTLFVSASTITGTVRTYGYKN